MRRLVLILVVAAAAGACGEASAPHPAQQVVEGDPATGRILARSEGCMACHAVEGMPGAIGIVGPPLHGFRQRAFIAGRVPNRPDQLIAFLVNPPAVDPETAMPDMGLSPADARNIAAWLYSLPERG
jgi:cytochrome c2